jgi:hypothetical protein
LKQKGEFINVTAGRKYSHYGLQKIVISGDSWSRITQFESPSSIRKILGTTTLMIKLRSVRKESYAKNGKGIQNFGRKT